MQRLCEHPCVSTVSLGSLTDTPVPRRRIAKRTSLLAAGWFAVGLVFAMGASAAAQWNRHTIDASSRGADGVRLADVNGDGLLDITTAWEEGGAIRVYLNPGPGEARQAWPAVTVGSVRSPEDAVFVDLDGDGATDVVSSCEGSCRTVYVHWAPRRSELTLRPDAWKTEPIPTTAGQQMWMFALPMQMDGENGLDLVVGSKGKGATIGWLQSPDNPRDLAAWTYHPLVQAGWIMSLRSLDLDGDGDEDILASDRKGSRRGVLWLENPGTSATAEGAEWIEHRVGAGDREVMFLAVADLDEQVHRAIICAVKGRGIAVYWRPENQADRWRTHEIQMPDGCGSGKGVAVCDMDLDGRQDLVFSCEHATDGRSGVRWLSYNRSAFDPVWQDHEISGPEGVKFDRIELLDLDHDGDQDVLACEERDNLGVFWYENPTR
jgi:hypothetical protein